MEWRELRVAFEELLGATPAEREARLAEITRRDPELAQRNLSSAIDRFAQALSGMEALEQAGTEGLEIEALRSELSECRTALAALAGS